MFEQSKRVFGSRYILYCYIVVFVRDQSSILTIEASCCSGFICHVLMVYLIIIRYITQEDLMRFLREDEASKTMHLFEGASEGKGISKRALKNWVVNVIFILQFDFFCARDFVIEINLCSFSFCIILG